MKGNQKHIVFLCSRLDLPGGIERAIVETGNRFSSTYRVTLLVLDTTANSFFSINEHIKVQQEPLTFGINTGRNPFSRKLQFYRDIKKLKQITEQLQPDLVIATEYPFAIAAILGRLRKLAPVISWEHHHFHELKRSLFWEQLFRQCYPRLDAVVVLNPDEKRLYETVSRSTFVIPNAVIGQAASQLDQPQLLTVARLTPVKGIERLLSIANTILKRYPEWRWVLLGDGELAPLVREYIDEHDLGKQLLVQTPRTSSIGDVYTQSSIYVMTSKNECFPMTLLESQAAGLPVIAFDCDTGPRHIIHDEKDGFLVDPLDTVGFTERLARIIDDPVLRKKMGTAAFAAVKQYDPLLIQQKWDTLIEQLLANYKRESD